VLRNSSKGLQLVFVPRHFHSRVVIHSMATVTGAVFAVRMGWGAPLWAGVAWYFGSFVCFHVVLAPFMALWYMLTDRAERWVRGIVEEELIRFDLRSYQGQLQRLLPSMRRPPNDHDEPGG
jgi:hypothetical protein